MNKICLLTLLSFIGNISLWAIFPKDNLFIVNDICYGEVINDQQVRQRLFMDMYKKVNVPNKLRPVIILVHGGGFNLGDKKQDLYVKIAQAFAERDYVAFSINYRLTTHKNIDVSVLDSAIADVMKAACWVKTHCDKLNIDPRKIIVAGDSAGGGIVVNAAYSPLGSEMFCGCIDLWGGLCFNRLDKNANQWGEPVNYYPIDQNVPPTCIIQGDDDEVIPFSTSRCLKEKLDSLNIYNELHVLEGALHYPEVLAEQFISQMLKFSDLIIQNNVN